jgi:hypothetical protein
MKQHPPMSNKAVLVYWMAQMAMVWLCYCVLRWLGWV